MDTNESTTELWLFPTGLAGKSGAKARRLTAGDKDSDPKWSPDGDCDRVHREAQGRRGAADLRDRARWRRGAAADVARHRLRGDQVVCRRQADRVRFVGVAGSRDRRASRRSARRSARTRRSRRTSPSARNSASGTIGSPTAASRTCFVCDVATGRCRDALAGTGLALPPWEPTAERLRHRARRPRDRADRRSRPEPRMMNQRDIVTVDLATRRKRVLTAATGHRRRARPSTRPTVTRSSSTRTTRSARSTTRDA